MLMLSIMLMRMLMMLMLMLVLSPRRPTARRLRRHATSTNVISLEMNVK